jgi:Major Facilitator Superfamily
VQTGSLVGPALGGPLVATTRASTWAFAIDAASFAISALTLALIPRKAAAGTVSAGAEGADGADADGGGGQGALVFLKKSRALQIILVVVIAANLAGGGIDGVALPSLAHDRFGAAGYGALLACFAAGSVLGTLAAARTGGLRRQAIFASAVFLIDGTALALTPYLGGEAGAAAAMFVAGAANGLGNVTFLTVLQKRTPTALLRRVMSALMLCAFGSYPLSVAVSGVLVRHIGPSLFFPIAGALVVVAILGGLTQREFREFGASAGPPREPKGAALPGLRSDEGATKEGNASRAPGGERGNRVNW